MKKFFVIFVVFCVCIFSLNAIDFGGLLTSNTEITNVDKSSFNLAQTTDAIFNLRIPFTNSGRSYFVAEAMYRNEMYHGSAHNYLDLPLFKANFLLDNITGNLNVSFGRYYLQDITGKIFSQSTDGVSLLYSSDVITSAVYAGYTGLINGNITDMVNPSDYKLDMDSVYNLSLPYVVVSTGLELPYLYMNQTLGFDFWSFIGTNDLDSTKIYVTLDFKGPIIASLFHTTSASILFDNSKANSVTGFLGSFNLNWFLSNLNTVLSAKINYASKDFTPVTANNFLVNGRYLNNMFATGIEASFKPKNNIYVLGDVLAVFKGDTADYYGTQLSGKVVWQVLSDVQLATFATWLNSNEDVAVTNFTVKAIMSF